MLDEIDLALDFIVSDHNQIVDAFCASINHPLPQPHKR